MQPTIIDRIIYTQILTRAGFTVCEFALLHTTRGDSVVAEGVFERTGATVQTVEIGTSGDHLVIAEQVHHVTIRPNGTFDLFTAHGDGD